MANTKNTRVVPVDKIVTLSLNQQIKNALAYPGNYNTVTNKLEPFYTLTKSTTNPSEINKKVQEDRKWYALSQKQFSSPTNVMRIAITMNGIVVAYYAPIKTDNPNADKLVHRYRYKTGEYGHKEWGKILTNTMRALQAIQGYRCGTLENLINAVKRGQAKDWRAFPEMPTAKLTMQYGWLTDIKLTNIMEVYFDDIVNIISNEYTQAGIQAAGPQLTTDLMRINCGLLIDQVRKTTGKNPRDSFPVLEECSYIMNLGNILFKGEQTPDVTFCSPRNGKMTWSTRHDSMLKNKLCCSLLNDLGPKARHQVRDYYLFDELVLSKTFTDMYADLDKETERLKKAEQELKDRKDLAPTSLEILIKNQLSKANESQSQQYADDAMAVLKYIVENSIAMGNSGQIGRIKESGMLDIALQEMSKDGRREIKDKMGW